MRNALCGSLLAAVLSAGVVVAPAGASAAAAETCTRTHTARRGESWWTISRRYRITLRRILDLNNARTSTKILIGDQVCVRAAPAPTTTVPLDTLPPVTAAPTNVPPDTLPPATAAPTTVPPDTLPHATAAPTTVPAPAPASAQAVIQIIREEWPDHLEEKALQVAWRESNYKPRVVGGTRNCCWGLFQIYYEVHKSWLPTVGVNAPEDLLDARTNARAAYRIYQRSGSWRPWGG
jgi:LysM repeat protein